MIRELLKELSLLNLPNDEYVIIGSGPLAIRNLRESKDLDILVSDKLWDKLAKQYTTMEKKGYLFIKVTENIEVHGSKSFPQPTGEDPKHKDEIKKAEMISGFPFQCVKHFLYYRYKYRSEKELADAKLMESWVRTQKEQVNL